MLVFRALYIVIFFVTPVFANADEGGAARAAIQKIAPLQQITAFRKSELPGYFEGIIGGQLAYASADGRFLVRGTVEDTVEGTNLSEISMAAKRREWLTQLGDDARLSFSPASPKFRLTVFTDVDCPFCQRLQSRIDDYNALGIAIDYVFFPLSIHPGADLKSISIWCSKDRQISYTAALRGQSPGNRQCPNPLAQMRQAGNEIGVVQTPTAVAEDGSLIDSTILMSPQRLVAELQKIAARTDSSPHAASAAAR
jgi:thiol:disulfide interchange protein DsbC